MFILFVKKGLENLNPLLCEIKNLTWKQRLQINCLIILGAFRIRCGPKLLERSKNSKFG